MALNTLTLNKSSAEKKDTNIEIILRTPDPVLDKYILGELQGKKAKVTALGNLLQVDLSGKVSFSDGFLHIEFDHDDNYGTPPIKVSINQNYVVRVSNMQK